MINLDWIKRPIAHRGLHCAAHGIVENSVSAIEAALDEGFAIEVDLRPSRCGTPMVFHDADLERLTEASGPLRNKLAVELVLLKFKSSFDKMMTLSDLLGLVDGQVPLVLEIKSDWSGDDLFEARIARILADYQGNAAVMSFDPLCVRAFAKHAPELPRGLVAERFGDAKYWHHLSRWQRFSMRHLLSAATARPHFIAYDIRALPAFGPHLARHLFAQPILTWTVRSDEEKSRANEHADAPIFERPCPAQTV